MHAADRGLTPLMLAAGAGRYQPVDELLRDGADPEVTDSFGRTALLFATEVGHIAIVRLLAQRRANLEAAAAHGQRRRALHHASMMGNAQLVQVLLDAKADAMAKTTTDTTPLHLAASSDNTEICMSLLQRRASPQALEGPDGSPVLISAVRTGSLDCVQLLLDFLVAPDVTNDSGHTALIVAAMENHTEVARALIDHSATVDEQDKDGLTAMVHASTRGHHQVARVLIANGGNRLACDKSGTTAISLLQNFGRPQRQEGQCWLPVASYVGCSTELDLCGADLAGPDRDMVPLAMAGPRCVLRKADGLVKG